jgi:hypothetical protein
MSGGLGHLKDPTFSIPMALDIFQGIQEMVDNFRIRNNPNTRALQNQGINQYNRLMGEAGSGAGIQNPFRDLSNYSRGQMTGQQDNILNPMMASLGSISPEASGASSFKMPDLSRALGDTSMYSQPYQTTAERTARDPNIAPTPPLENVGPTFGENIRNFFQGFFEQGTTSVPNTGLAVVHQGEAIIPRNQNPAALPPGQPGVPMAPPPIPAPPAAGMPPNKGLMVNPNTSFPAGQGLAPNTNLPAAGLNPNVMGMIQSQGNEQINQQLQGQRRALAEQASAQGNAFGGNLNNQMFEASMAANQQKTNLARDLAIEAENRRFADEMAKAQFGLNQQTALGQLGLSQQELALRDRLGTGQLDLDRNLGMGQLALQGELGRGSLGVEQQLANLQDFVGRGNLGIAQQQQNLAAELGRGELGLGRRQQDLAAELGRGQLALDRLLGTGGLNVQQQLANLQGELGRGQLGLDTQLGLGRLGIDRQLANLQGELGRGQLDIARQDQNFAQNQQFGEAQRQFNEQMALDRLLGQGQLGLGERGLGLQEQIHRNDVQFGQYDRSMDLLQALLGRQDTLAGTDAGANQGQEQFLQDYIDRLIGQSAGFPQTAGTGA